MLHFLSLYFAGDDDVAAVAVTDLTFTYDGMDKPVLRNFDLNLPKGSRYDRAGVSMWLEYFVVISLQTTRCCRFRHESSGSKSFLSRCRHGRYWRLWLSLPCFRCFVRRRGAARCVRLVGSLACSAARCALSFYPFSSSNSTASRYLGAFNKSCIMIQSSTGVP